MYPIIKKNNIDDIDAPKPKNIFCFNIKSLEIKIRHAENQKFVKNKSYEIVEKDGSLEIQ